MKLPCGLSRSHDFGAFITAVYTEILNNRFHWGGLDRCRQSARVNLPVVIETGGDFAKRVEPRSQLGFAKSFRSKSARHQQREAKR